MRFNVPDRHKEFETFIAYVVAEVKKGPDEPVKFERIGTYDKERIIYPKEE